MDKKEEDKGGEDGETKVAIFPYENLYDCLHNYNLLIVSQCAVEEDTGDEEREAVNSTGVNSAQMDFIQSTL